MTIKNTWSPLRDTLKKVVTKHQDRDHAKAINDELDKLSQCKTDNDHINRMVVILEEEYIGTKKICEWFVEVLKDDDIKKSFASEKMDDAIRCTLIKDIEKKISEIDSGPISKK